MRSAKAKIAVSLGAVLGFVVVSYFFLDVPIALLCKRLDRGVTDFFGIITEFGISTWYLIGSFGLFLIFSFVHRQKMYASRALFLFASIAVSGIIANIIKVILGRYRPEMFFEKGLYGLNFFNFSHGFTSFPSGHTATTFSLAWTLSLFFPRARILLICFAFLVGASRVIITSHYLSDAVGGAYVGVMSVLFLKEFICSPEQKFSCGLKM
ncbi:MAG: phosphatase PAP2 family protein [Thermodesulfobacteriota bacterium]|jgi:membrane-associated phospholipid phosphatase